jgi:hypothetical protein
MIDTKQRFVLAVWLLTILLGLILASPSLAQTNKLAILDYHLTSQDISVTFNKEFKQAKPVNFILITDRGEKLVLAATLDEVIDGTSSYKFDTSNTCRTMTIFWSKVKVYQPKQKAWKVFDINQTYQLRCEL